MSSIGKAIRLERIINRNSGRTVIVPMDHGITLGPIRGLRQLLSSQDRVGALADVRPQRVQPLGIRRRH